MSRHTMGQDWGGRRKLNPNNAPVVTAKEVEDYAASMGVTVFRATQTRYSLHPSSRGTWWYETEKGYVSLGDTNFIALQTLKCLEGEAKAQEGGGE